MELPHDPAIPLLGIYPEKTVLRKDTRTSTFQAARFTAAKTRRRPTRPSTHEWVKEMWYIYAVEILFRHKKERNHAICSNMDVTRHYHAKCSKSEKNEHHMMSFICGIKEMI